MGVSRPLPRNMAGFQKTRAQAIQVWWEIQFVQEACHLVQVQAGDVFRSAVFDDLADVSLALEGIGEIGPVGAPDDVSRGRDDGHIGASKGLESATPPMRFSCL